MATLTQRNGLRILQFSVAGGGRATIYLGRIPEKVAVTIRSHVEHLVNAAATSSAPPLATAQWAAGLGEEMHAKLAKAKLVTSRALEVACELGAFLDGYIARRTDLKERTVANLKQTRESLVRFFGASRDLRAINRAEARDWQRKELESRAAATVATFVKKARQFFADAADRGLVSENPFAKLKAGSQVNAARNQYIPAADVDAVIAVCPGAEWRLVFALARYAGLRTPSEGRLLRWADVLWDRGRILVHSPKTEHHQGGDSRLVPIMPKLLPYLRDAFEAASPGAEYVLPRLRGENLRTTAEKIVRRAGLTRWPRLFQNLRASCETDLTAEFPLHVVCAWIGNSQLVAARHYLQVTEDHFDRASGAALQKALRAAPPRGVQGLPLNAETPSETGFAANQYPQGESNRGPDSREKQQVVHEALQKALHPPRGYYRLRGLLFVSRPRPPRQTSLPQIKPFLPGGASQALIEAGYKPLLLPLEGGAA